MPLAHAVNAISVYQLPVATKQYQVLENTFPLPGPEKYSTSISVTPGEFEPASFVLRATTEDLSGINLQASSLTEPGGGTIQPNSIDIRLVKTWYQLFNGNGSGPGKYLVPELLVKDDALVNTDRVQQTSSLRATVNGITQYFDISSANSGARVPDNAIVQDLATLQPFSLLLNTNKQVWVTVQPPIGTPHGTYTGFLNISVPGKPDTVVTLTVNVLPFTLVPSLVEQALYYRGVEQNACSTLNSECKTYDQLRADLINMRDHGILYPSIYQSIYSTSGSTNLGRRLDVMADIGLPKDKIYELGDTTNNQTDPVALVTNWISVASDPSRLGGVWKKDQVYFYGIDEAAVNAVYDTNGNILKNSFSSQADAWTAVHTAGGKVFTALNIETATSQDPNTIATMSLLDVAVLYGYNVYGYDVTSSQVETVTKSSNPDKPVFKYGQPFSGYANPEFERHYYGLYLVASGYSGAMNYVYQAMGKNGEAWNWNDFYPISAEEKHMYTYPATNGPVDTIEWEGHREGIDDIRYVSTLADRKGWAKADAGKYTSDLMTIYSRVSGVPDSAASRRQVIHDILAIDGIPVSPVSSANLVGYWKFNGSVADDSGNGHDGTLKDVDTPLWSGGKVDGSLQFDGQNDRVHVPDAAALKYKGGDITFSTWIFPNSTETDGGYIISKPWNSSGQYNYSIQYNPDSNNSADSITVSLKALNNSNYSLTSTKAVTKNAWHHVAVTIASDTSVNIYVDGILNTSGSHNISTWNPDGNVTGTCTGNDIGKDCNISLVFGYVYPYMSSQLNSGFSFDGKLDDLRIYNRVLTESEITSLYNAYVLTVSKSGNGTVASSSGTINCGKSCSASYGANTSVTLTAIPDATTDFGGWTGCDTVSGVTCTVSMSDSKMVTANFSAKSTDLSVNFTPMPPTSVPQGSIVSYTLNVTNNGPSSATGVAVTGTLPTCTIVNLAAGATATCPTSTVTASTVGTLTQTMTVSGAETDSNVFNNTALASTTVTINTQTITVTTAAPTSAGNGSAFTVAASASSGLPVAITAIGGCSIVGSTVTMNSSTTACTVNYNQAGDSNYMAATQVSSKTTPLTGIDLVPLSTNAARVTGSSTRVSITETVKNQGNTNAGSFTIRYYLSTNTTYESTDFPLVTSSNGTTPCNRKPKSLSAGSSSTVSGGTICYKPHAAATGVTYNVLVVDDWGTTFPGGAITEYNEANNVSVAGTVQW